MRQLKIDAGKELHDELKKLQGIRTDEKRIER